MRIFKRKPYKALSVMMALALIVGLLPGMTLTVMALDDQEAIVGEEELIVAGVDMFTTKTIDERTEGVTSGTAVLSGTAEQPVLTLTNFSYSGSPSFDNDMFDIHYCAVINWISEEKLTIKLVGENALILTGPQSKNAYGINVGAMYAGLDILSESNGSLTVISSVLADDDLVTTGISVNGGSLTIDGCTVIATGGDISSMEIDGTVSYGVEVGKCVFIRNNATLIATGGKATESYGVYAGDDVVFNGYGTLIARCDADADNDESCGVYGGVQANGSFAEKLSIVAGSNETTATKVTKYPIQDEEYTKYVRATAAEPVAEVGDVEYAVFNDNDTDATNDAVHAWLAADDGTTLTLLTNVETSATIKIASGVKTIDLNGHGIAYTGMSGNVLSIGSDATLNLNDGGSSASNTIYIKDRRGSLKNTEGAAAVVVTGGFITGGTGAQIGGDGPRRGGGVEVYGNSCAFIMNGGTIIGNTATFGGGVDMYDSGCTFTMNGGSVINNVAESYAGGVYVDKGTFTMNGGAINGNAVISPIGGGVLIGNGGTFNASGSPTIIDNTANNHETINNVYLDEGKKIVLTAALKNGANIGVTLANGYNDVFTSGWDTNMGDATPESFFTSDNSTYSVLLDEDKGELKLGVALIYYTDHEVDVGTGAVTATTKSTTDYTAFSAGVNSTLTTIPAGWYVIRSGEAVATNRLSVSGTVNLILCDGARLIADKGIKVGSNDTLNIFVGNTTNKIAGTGMLRAAGSDGAAGIGGLRDMSGGTVNIHGGMVIAVGAENAMGIGRGYGTDMKNGTLTVAPGLYIYGGATEPVSYIEAGDGGAYTGDRYRYMIVNNVAPKTPQEIATQDVTATYGDTDVSVNVALAGNGTITYAVKTGSEDYIAVDASTGALTIRGVPADGKAYVIVTAAETNEGGTNNRGYAKATKEVPIIISKAELTVKAKDQSIYVGDTVPTLGADSYTVTGLVGSDELTKAPTLTYQKNGNATTPTSSTTGTYDIVPSGAEASSNYTITYANGTLTISNRPSPGGGNGSSGGSGSSSGGGSGSSGGSSGSSGSSGGGGNSPATTTVTVPVSGDSGSVNVSVTIADDTATISDGNLDSVLSEAADTGTVTIDVSGVGSEIAEAVIPSTMVEKIVEAVADENNDADGLEVKLSTGTVAFDAVALEAIADQMTGRDLRLNFDDVETKNLNTAQQAAVRELDVQAIFDVYLMSGSQRISDFRGGTATVSIPYSLKEGQNGNGLSVWYAMDSGERVEMPTTYVGGVVSFVTGHFSDYVLVYDEAKAAICPRDNTCPIAEFSDVAPTAWYHDGVHFVLENDIMSGYGDGRFGPNDATSRAMMAQILYNMENRPASDYALSYSDVSSEAWYAEAVRWATANDVMSGYGKGFFGPTDVMTREQLVTIVYRYAVLLDMDVSIGEDTNILSYDDAFDVAEWAVPAMQWAVGSGIITGRTASTLNPKDSATRAEIATIMMRFAGLMGDNSATAKNSSAGT